MCTAITYKGKNFYFGRNLDYEHGFGERLVITPGEFVINFRNIAPLKTHYSIMGIATVSDNFPLYYDAVNEKGLCAAGLNFVGNAEYNNKIENADNICHFEVILYLLSLCRSVKEVCARLKKANITNEPFSKNTPPARLHWIIADKHECIVLESMKDGLHIHKNPVGVLTNNPPFPMQLFALNNYLNLAPAHPKNNRWADAVLSPYSRGMGALGLPGDTSSQSRFVRAAFVKSFSRCDDCADDTEQFFHILDSVKQIRGCTLTENNGYEYTLYTSCCNADKGIYYVSTYANRQIRSFDMHSNALSKSSLTQYPIYT